MEENIEKKPFNPIWFLIIGIAVLIIPTAIYLCFLIPSMKDEYIILMSSGGVVGAGGMFGTEMIPDKTKYGFLYKTASKSFTFLVVITLVKDFIGQILGLIAVLIVSFIVFQLMRSLYKNGKRARENKELATEVAQSVAKSIK